MTSLSTYDFSTLYTTLPHNLIKDKLIDLIERTFQREGSPYLACNDRNAFFTSEKPKKYHAWSCQNVCDALTFLLDNIFVRFGTKLYGQVDGIPMGTNCAPLVADLFLFCYERDFMMSLSDDKQADVIDAFNTTSRYLDDILNINNVYFDNMVSQIYPSELQLNKANASDTEVAFLDLHLSISNDIVSTKIYDKRDDFDFEIVNFPFLDGDVPRSTSYGVYISQLIRFARASSYVADFNTRNRLLTQKLLKQGYRYHKLRKTFSKFYRRYYDLISKFQVGLKYLMRQGLSEPDFYGDLVYKLKKIVGSNNFGGGGMVLYWVTLSIILSVQKILCDMPQLILTDRRMLCKKLFFESCSYMFQFLGFSSIHKKIKLFQENESRAFQSLLHVKNITKLDFRQS